MRTGQGDDGCVARWLATIGSFVGLTAPLLGSVVALPACSTEPTDGETGALGLELAQNNAGGAIQAGDEFGAVLVRGNFNGDAYQDLAVGSPGEDSDAGAVFIFMGSASGLGSGFYFKQSHSGQTNEAGDRFGAALAAGDLNADGRDDLVVGAPGEDSEAGMVGVWLGSATGLSTSGGRFFFANDFGCGANEAGDEFGAALAIGNFNADGFPDLATGAPGENNDAGWFCVTKGRATTGVANGSSSYYSQSTAGVGSPEAGDRFAQSLAAGVVTSGAHADLVVGAPGEDSGAGAVMVHFGSGSAATAAGSFFTSGVILRQTDAGAADEAGDAFGQAVAVANLNGDAFADVIAGAPSEVVGGVGGGVIFTFPGAASGPTTGVWYEQTGTVPGVATETGDAFGSAFASGDFDGNGVVELAVGAKGKALGSPASGLIVTFPGSAAGLEIGTAYDQTDINGSNEAGDLFGAALAAGDFNGDGATDLAIGAPGEAPGASPAGGYVSVLEGDSSVSLSLGPILGGVSDDGVKIWVRANQEVNFKVAYAPAAGGSEVQVDHGTLDEADDYTGSVALSGLSADTLYEYRVLLANQEHFAGTFRTLPASGEPGEIVFAYGADLSVVHRPFETALAVESDEPHFLILGGDNIYADTFITVPDSKAAYEARYRQTFGDEHLRSCMSAIPTFMTWDDHEISNDWYPGKNARYANARAAFDEYQGSHNPDPLTAGELYYSFSAGESDFIVLDTRTHRSPNSATDGPSKTLLGATQRTALLNFLDNSTAKFKFIVSSVPFNVWATTNDDAWESYLHERDAILSHVRDNAIPGVVLLSGDQHWAGVFRLAHLSPYPFYEFMPTPMGTGNRTQTSSNDSQILYKNDDYVGYGRFTINTAMTPATLTFEWVDSSGVVRHSLSIDEDDIVP